VKAQSYSFEAANVRHEHEMSVWKEVKLAPGTILMPGMISHATNIVEHPELGRLLSGTRTSLAGPTAAWEAGCMPRLVGRSSQRLPKGGSRDENLVALTMNHFDRDQPRAVERAHPQHF